MKKVVWFLVLLLGIGIFSSNFVFAVGFHNASNIGVSVNGVNMSLQDAINFNNLARDAAYADFINGSYYHTISDIIIETDSGIGYKNLLEALQGQDFTDATIDSLLELGGMYHLSSEVNVDVFKGTIPTTESLQTAINNKDIGCVADVGANCDFSPCVYGIIDCVGNCVGNGPKNYGSDCGSGKICNGEGACDNKCVASDCGVDSCSAWSGWTSCSGSTLTRHRTCVNYYCNGDNTCGSSSTTQSNTYTCAYGCTTSCPRTMTGGGCVYGCASAPPDDSGKVICTEMHRIGLMSDKDYALDVKYAHDHFSDDALKGYRSWGMVVVRAMRKHPDSMKVVVPMVNAFMQEIKYRSGESNKSSEMGAYYLDEAVPLFARIGKHIDDPNWEQLFDQNSWAVKEMQLIRNIFKKKNPNDKVVEDYFTEKKVSQMFYDALGNKTKPDMEFTRKFVDELRNSTEELETQFVD